MTTSLRTLRAHPIDADVLARMRAAGADDFGNPFEPWTAGGGEPVRCCLRAATPGEALALVSYSPHRRPSPWAETGPVFVHLSSCDGYDPADGLPAELRTGPRVLRSYRADGSMDYDGIVTVPEGVDVAPALDVLLRRPGVVEVHVRAAEAQCFTYRVLLSET